MRSHFSMLHSQKTDVKAIDDSGLSIALGFAAVSPQAKLTTAWAKLKSGMVTR